MFADITRLQNHLKWGFIIYRCDYRNDLVWAQFIDQWTQWVNDWLIRNGDRQLIKNLAWTVREDRAALNSATVEDVRSLFTAWTKTEEAIAEQQNAVDSYILGSPRFQFCVHVDAKALDECLRFNRLPEDTQSRFWIRRRDPALGHAPYVNLVEKCEEYTKPLRHDKKDKEDDDEGEEEEDEDEDSDEEIAAISVKVHWRAVIPDVFVALNHSLDEFQRMIYDVDQDGVHS
ncbi:hypothetical protein N0V86_007554 [Didymella sp. IMI 355093]|nr:hypothetical protein N0V86_007554 [Didymella sp. IMI 355093]